MWNALHPNFLVDRFRKGGRKEKVRDSGKYMINDAI